MFRLIYVYNTFLYLGMLALWLLAFFHIIAMYQYGLLFPQHCGLGGALGGLAVVGGGFWPLDWAIWPGSSGLCCGCWLHCFSGNLSWSG